MGAWLRCAIPTLPTDILDQHSSVLHILASEEFVAVADLTVSGCRDINSYTAGSVQESARSSSIEACWTSVTYTNWI